jgi:hypothetical protein
MDFEADKALNDGLLEEWDYPTVYVNPPYGNDKERETTINRTSPFGNLYAIARFENGTRGKSV